MNNQEIEQNLEKSLPSNPQAEKIILGAIFLDNTLMSQALELLKADDFYSPVHKTIFIAMAKVSEKSDKIDPILVMEELKKVSQFENIGGLATITNLTFGLPHFSDIETYCIVVRDKSKIRKLIRLCDELTGICLAEEQDVEEIFEYAESKIFELSAVNTQSKFRDAVDIIAERVVHINQVSQTGNPITGLPTGLLDFDTRTLGLQKKDLIIIAARPGVGKTAIAMGISTNAAFNLNQRVAFFSLEMGEEQLADRIIAFESRVDSQKLRSGLLSATDWAHISEATMRLTTGKLFIDETPAINIVQLYQKIRRLLRLLKLAHPTTPIDELLNLVVVDYIGLMSGLDGKRSENRQVEVSQISRGLKQAAKTFNVPLIALSQLNRGPENRANHTPTLADLRESGSIEQDADLVAFIMRESMYPKSDGSIMGVGEADLIIAKQRNGPTGSIKLAYMSEITRFDNLIQHNNY